MSDKEKTAAASAAANSTTQEDPSVKLAAAEKEIIALKTEIAAHKAELEDAKEIIEDLKDQLKDNVNKVPTVKVGKEKFLVVGGFVKRGKKYTAKDIAANPELAAELVSKGSGLLIESK
jgi:ribosomal protein L7/L12